MLNILKNRLHFRIPQSVSIQIYNFSNIYRNFHDEFTNPPIPPAKEKPKPNPLPTAVASKFEIFKDEDSTIILDIAEERMKMQKVLEHEQKVDDIYEGLNLESM